MAYNYNENDKQVKVDGRLFTLKDDKLYTFSMQVNKNNHLVGRWHIARGLEGCSNFQLIEAYKLLIKNI